MGVLRRALGNSSMMLLSQVIAWTTTILLAAAIGRQLGVRGFGALYLAMSFIGIFGVLIEFGFDQQLVRAVARDRSLAGPYLGNSIAIKLCLAGLTYVLIIAISSQLQYSAEQRHVMYVYGSILFFRGLSSSLASVYLAAQSVFYSAAGAILEKILVLAIAVSLLYRGHGAAAVAAAYVLGAAANVAWQAYFLRSIIAIELSVGMRMMRKVAGGALPFLVYWGLTSVYDRIDVVLLSVLTEPVVVGWYGAAYRFFETLYFLPGIVSSAIMFPILSQLSETSRSGFRLAMRWGLDVILILGIPMCTGLFVLADPIIRFLYGDPNFLNAVPALRWLAIGLLFQFVHSVLATTAFSLNGEKKGIPVVVMATILNIGLNWLLIPSFQHVAAAAVTAATQFFILCYWLALLPRDLLVRASMTVLLKSAAASAVMSAVLYGLRGYPVLLLVPAGGLAYCLSAVFLRLVSAEDAHLFKQVLVARRTGDAAGVGRAGARSGEELS